MLQTVILCGGEGTRLWPASRKLLPKQFMPLHNTTLFKETVKRALSLEEKSSLLIVCNVEYRFLAAAQLEEVLVELEPSKRAQVSSQIILEPMGRNTAPAVALAAFHCLDQNALLLVLPADHYLEETTLFSQLISEIKAYAEQGKLLTFGIKPQSAETGYGYIEAGKELSPFSAEVLSFVEKPDLETAQKLILQKNMFWNSGMFLFKASAYLDELKRYAPEMYLQTKVAYEKKQSDLDFIRIDEESFLKSPSDSIDYAVFEHTKKALVCPLKSAWSDLGSWESIYKHSSQDENKNVTDGNVITKESDSNLIISQSRLVAALGVSNLVIVDTEDALLVATLDATQKMKELVSELKSKGLQEQISHIKVFRPWGSYTTMMEGQRFKVKQIVVNPQQQLSLQKHLYRAEHWVIVKGQAHIRLGEKEFTLIEDQSTYIPIGEVHRLANKSNSPLEVIEVQTGSYLGEDDIIRMDDIYGR